MGGGAMSELLTVAEVAQIMRQSEDSVTRLFAKMPGVIDLGRAESRSKRRYRVLRIPKAVLEKFLATKAGHPVRVEAPPRPERRRQSNNWKNLAVLNLAKIGKQNGCEDRETFKQIAHHARWLVASIPEEYWVEVCSSSNPMLWDDEEER
jgi:hypothetical protein